MVNGQVKVKVQVPSRSKGRPARSREGIGKADEQPDEPASSQRKGSFGRLAGRARLSERWVGSGP